MKRAIDVKQSRFTINVCRLSKRECFSIINPITCKEKKISKEFWRIKYHQSLKLERNRVIIDNHEYLINLIDGFLAEINKEINNYD